MFRTLALALTLGLATASGVHAADKLNVMLEWFVNPDHAPMVIARENGLFEKAGLDVTLVPPADPSIVPRAVASGQADIGIHYQPNLYLDRDAGLDLVRFGTLVETPLNSVTVLADGPVKTIADLKGRKIGFSVSGFEQVMLSRMLENAGLKMSDVELINVNFALTPSLISGKVDATIGGFRNFEHMQMKQEGAAARAFFPEENGVPVYDELIYVTRSEMLKDDRLKRFLGAVEEGAIWMTNHPDEAWQLFIKAYPNLDDALNRQAWIDTLPRFAKRPAALDHERYARFGAFLAENGLIKQAPDVKDVAVELR